MRVSSILPALLLFAVTLEAGEASPAESRPIPGGDVCDEDGFADPADDLLEAFAEGRRFVFIGSSHGGLKRHRFLICVLSRPRAAGLVTDVLAEFVSASTQSELDRYLLDLADVPESTLARAWNDTMDLGVWARMPIPERFLREVRALNERLPKDERFRVLGGSTPVDWSRIRTTDDLARHPPKTNWTAHFLATELWPRTDRRVLVAYGENHNHYRGGGVMGHLLKTVRRSATFVVGSVARLKEGEAAELGRFGDPARPFLARFGAAESEVSLDALFYTHGAPVGESLDAILYLGPAADESLRNTLELEPELEAEIRRRTALLVPELIELQARYRDGWFQSTGGRGDPGGDRSALE